MMLSLVMPYYMNPDMLALQFATWAEWSDKAKAQIEIVIVDASSPQPAVEVERPDGLPELRIFRVAEDRPWAQHAARNIGANEATAPWLLLTDMDHVLTAEYADALLKRLGQLDANTAYFLHRIEADTGLPTVSDAGDMKPHPNSFVMSKALYWRAGGYDEDYCGVYGTDGLFKSRLFAIAERGFLKKVPLVRYWRDIMPDASTTTLARKEGRTPGAKEAVAARKAAEGRTGQIATFLVPWERVL
jgi:hypothetical protein